MRLAQLAGWTTMSRTCNTEAGQSAFSREHMALDERWIWGNGRDRSVKTQTTKEQNLPQLQWHAKTSEDDYKDFPGGASRHRVATRKVRRSQENSAQVRILSWETVTVEGEKMSMLWGQKYTCTWEQFLHYYNFSNVGQSKCSRQKKQTKMISKLT